MADDIVALRNALVKRLEANPALTAAWDDRMYGEKVPADPVWPFGRYGYPISTSDEASGWTGSRERVTIHVFARGPSMDACAALCKHVKRELDGQDVDLVAEGGDDRVANVFELFHAGTQILPDGDDWHGVVEFNASIAGA